MRVGIRVYCTTCGHSKCPRGRSQPLGMYMCDRETCRGYDDYPQVGSLWPGESEEDFGYPCGIEGTIESPEETKK